MEKETYICEKCQHEIPILNNPAFWAKMKDNAATANIEIEEIVDLANEPWNGATKIYLKMPPNNDPLP